MKSPITFDNIRASFDDNTIHSATNDELESAVSTLVNTRIPNSSVQHEAVVMASAIHSILLRRLLDQQERRNHRTQFWFMVLAAAGVIGAIVQVLIAAF